MTQNLQLRRATIHKGGIMIRSRKAGSMWQTERIFLLSFVLTAGGCSHNSVMPRNSDTQQINSISQNVPPDTKITLERIECDLTCPVYKLTISADGAVTFEGRRFVKRTGVIKSSISQEKLAELVSAFERMNYFSLKDDYTPAGGNCPEAATDYPTAITSIRLNGKLKSVEHYYGCRGNDTLQELTNIETKIDEITNTQQWVK